MTNGEAREMARGLVRGSIIEDAASQFIALILKETHDSRIKPLRAEVEALAAKLSEVEAALPAVYRLALGDAARRVEARAAANSAFVIRRLPTPTAAELMARITSNVPFLHIATATRLDDPRVLALVGLLQRARQEMRLIRMNDSGAVYDVHLRTEIDAALSTLETKQ